MRSSSRLTIPAGFSDLGPLPEALAHWLRGFLTQPLAWQGPHAASLVHPSICCREARGAGTDARPGGLPKAVAFASTKPFSIVLRDVKGGLDSCKEIASHFRVSTNQLIDAQSTGKGAISRSSRKWPQDKSNSRNRFEASMISWPSQQRQLWLRTRVLESCFVPGPLQQKVLVNSKVRASFGPTKL